jgi:hypothetical protein
MSVIDASGASLSRDQYVEFHPQGVNLPGGFTAWSTFKARATAKK